MWRHKSIWVIILLNAIPRKYKEVKNVIKYGRETLTLEIIIHSLKSNKIELKSFGLNKYTWREVGLNPGLWKS